MEQFLFEKKKFKNYLGNELYDILKKYNTIIAGGTITSLFTNRDINDIDVYFRSQEDLESFLKNEMEGQWIIAHTEKALLFKFDDIEVQAIYFKYFNNPDEIFDTFDFTVCMGAYDFSKEEFVLHNDFLRHNSQRILKFNHGTAYPIVSALRVDKYKKKGYTISKPEFIRIMLTILNSDIHDYKTLKEQMGGMYGENYDKILEPQENEEFDLENIIEKMSELSVNDDYFKVSQSIDIDCWAEFVDRVLGKKTKCFKHNDLYYKVCNDEVRKFDDYNENQYELLDISEFITFPLTRYKYVKFKDGEYRSYFDKKYEYKIGEYHAKKNEHRGLHAVKESRVDSCTYSDERDNVLLELRVDSIDDIFCITKLLDDQCEYNRVFVVREIPKDEEKQMREMIKDEVDFWL